MCAQPGHLFFYRKIRDSSRGCKSLMGRGEALKHSQVEKMVDGAVNPKGSEPANNTKCSSRMYLPEE